RRQHDVERDAALGPCRRGRRPGDHASEGVASETERNPAVAERERAAERARRASAEPDGDVVLHAARGDDVPVEAVVRARVRRLRATEGSADGTDRILVRRATAGEVDAEEPELLLERPDADAEDDPPAREPIERPVALRDRERVVIR